MSKPKPKFSGKIENLQFIPDNPVKYKQRLTELNNKQVNIVVTRYRENRSDNQNQYYWGVIISMIASHCDYLLCDHESLHEELKKKFLGTHGRLQLSASSANLNTKEFEEYLSNIRTWASLDLGLYIPVPNEIELIERY